MASRQQAQSLQTSFAMSLSGKSSFDRDDRGVEGLASEPEGEPWKLIINLENAFKAAALDFAADVDRRLERGRLALSSDDDLELSKAALGISFADPGITIQVARARLIMLAAQVEGSGQAEFDAFPFVHLNWDSGGVTLIIEAAEFAPGSLIGELKALAKPIVFLPLLVGAVAIAPVPHAYDLHVQSTRIEEKIRGSDCRASVDFRMSVADLRRLSAEQMDWTEPGIGADEQRLRLCRVQFALRLKGFPVGRLDGIEGTNTDAAMASFMKSNGLQGHRPSDFIVRDTLAVQSSQVVLA